MSKNSLLEKIEVKTPCSENWDEMRGTDEARFCSHCDLSVNNLSAMTRKEALKIVRASDGRICVRYVRNLETNAPIFDGRLHQISRRAPRLAIGAMTAAISLSSIGYAQTNETPETEIVVTRINQNGYFEPVDAEKTPEPKTDGAASVSGTISDPSGAVVPNVTVILIDEESKVSRTTVSDSEGFYEFKTVEAGNYSIKAEGAMGFKTFIYQNVVVAESAKTKQDIQMELSEQIALMGVVAFTEYENPLFRAVSNDELDEVKNLIAKGESVNSKDENYSHITPLFLAVENGNAEIAELLLGFGAKPNARDDERRTPLMRLDEEASPELVKLLIKYGAKINLTDKEGNTALILAASGAKAEVLQVLITGGANINAQNKEGRTALMNAAAENDLESVRVLVLGGAKVNLKDKDGETAWDLATDDEIEKVLESHGAKPEDN